MQETLDRYKTGIYIQKVTLQNVQPPDKVQAAFDDAVKAGQDRVRLVNEGQAYANDVVPRARGMASRLMEEANGYNTEVIQSSEGDASRFKSVLSEYAKAPGVTRDRLYLDMMQSVLGNTTKVLIDQKAGGNLLYLPLDKLIQQSAAAAATVTPDLPSSAPRPSRRAGAGTRGDARPQPVARRHAQPRALGDATMKFTMPILALIVALLLVASQSIYTVDQTQVRDQVPVGRDRRDQDAARPVLQGAAGAERPLLRQPQPDAREQPSPTA